MKKLAVPAVSIAVVSAVAAAVLVSDGPPPQTAAAAPVGWAEPARYAFTLSRLPCPVDPLVRLAAPAWRISVADHRVVGVTILDGTPQDAPPGTLPTLGELAAHAATLGPGEGEGKEAYAVDDGYPIVVPVPGDAATCYHVQEYAPS